MRKRRIIAAMIAIAVLTCCCPSVAFAKAGEYVTVGGFAMGIELDIDGVAVVGVSADNVLSVGDVIQKVDGKTVSDVTELKSALRQKSGARKLSILRDGKEIVISAKTTEAKGLGVTVRDKIRGIGTVTYIKDDNTFASLGHQVGGGKSKTPVAIDGGTTSAAIVLGVNKGEKGKAGELKAVFVEREELKGRIIKNTTFGVYGKLEKAVKNPVYAKKVRIASIDEIALGKATILATTDGKTVKEYAIEIISKSNQKTPHEKGMVIKVVDKELLSVTGGIVQGMSGSPVMQNGKLVGAVTHVFLNDATRGYAIFAEFMD